VVLLDAEDDELGEEGLELLAVALLDERAVDVAVGLLAVEELFEVGEAVGVDAVVGEVEVLEVEVPVVVLVVGIAGEEGALHAGDVAQALGDEVLIGAVEAMDELGPGVGADVGVEGLGDGGRGRRDGDVSGAAAVTCWRPYWARPRRLKAARPASEAEVVRTLRREMGCGLIRHGLIPMRI
jgi:hypothetical protein